MISVCTPSVAIEKACPDELSANLCVCQLAVCGRLQLIFRVGPVACVNRDAVSPSGVGHNGLPVPEIVDRIPCAGVHRGHRKVRVNIVGVQAHCSAVLVRRTLGPIRSSVKLFSLSRIAVEDKDGTSGDFWPHQTPHENWRFSSSGRSAHAMISAKYPASPCPRPSPDLE